jgi:hypothetical protein
LQQRWVCIKITCFNIPTEGFAKVTKSRTVLLEKLAVGLLKNTSLHRWCLRVASGVTTPGPALEEAPCFRPKVVLMSLSTYILRQIGNADTCSI